MIEHLCAFKLLKDQRSIRVRSLDDGTPALFGIEGDNITTTSYT
jgi:hypothetical protein